MYIYGLCLLNILNIYKLCYVIYVYYTILHVYITLYYLCILYYMCILHYIYTGYSYIFLHGMGEIRGAVEGYGDSALKEVAHVVSIGIL